MLNVEVGRRRANRFSDLCVCPLRVDRQTGLPELVENGLVCDQ